MKEKLEYEKFLILLELRIKVKEGLNYQRIKKRLRFAEERILDDNLKYADEIFKLSKELFSIELITSVDQLDNLIFESWPYILEGLINGKYNYEWSLSSFLPSLNEIKVNPDAVKLYGALQLLNRQKDNSSFRKAAFESNTIYFLLSSLKNIDCNYNEIYRQLIENNLYNPNKRDINASYWPFWTKNNIQNITELDKKIILDKRTNYKMDSNGSDIIKSLARFYIDNDYPECSNTYIELIDSAIRLNNCSIIEDYFDEYIEYGSKLPLIYTLFENEVKINELEGLHHLYEYCISEEGVLRQVEVSTHPSPLRNDAIDFYISLIENDNPKNTNGIAMLKQIKI